MPFYEMYQLICSWGNLNICKYLQSLTMQLFTILEHQRKHQSPCYWSLIGESTSDWWILSQRASNTESVSVAWRHHANDIMVAMIGEAILLIPNLYN